MGGKFHLRLNSGKRPIANKYREGKMKSTLKRELKAREIVKRETLEARRHAQACGQAALAAPDNGQGKVAASAAL